MLSPAAMQRVDHGLWLALALGVCASGPVIAATIHALIDGWLPAGDQANIATRAYDVFTSRARVARPRQALIAFKQWLWT